MTKLKNSQWIKLGLLTPFITCVIVAAVYMWVTYGLMFKQTNSFIETITVLEIICMFIAGIIELVFACIVVTLLIALINEGIPYLWGKFNKRLEQFDDKE